MKYKTNILFDMVNIWCYYSYNL